MRTLVLLLLLTAPAVAAPLAAHHAVYALTLHTSRTGNVTSAHGSMTYDVADVCTAWATTQHLAIDMTDAEGRVVHLISDYATLESKDGTHLDFHTKQVTDGAVTDKLDGVAVLEHSGGRGHADFTVPAKTTVLLPEGTLLPLAHTSALLDASVAGKKFLSVPLFDGSGADGAQDTFVTIENWHAPKDAKTPPKWAALRDLPSGGVHISFFARSTNAETPDYEIAMIYYLNGVADSLLMNFGDFQMDGRLGSLDIKPVAHC